MISKFQLHEHLSQKVLVRIAFQLQHRLSKEYRKHLLLGFVVAFDSVQIELFSRLKMALVHRIGNGAGC